MLPTLIHRRGYRPFSAPFDLLNDTMGRLMPQAWDDEDRPVSYPVDIREDSEAFYVEAELPGFKKDEVNVTLENGTLTIAAERIAEKKEGAEHLHERRHTRVQRSFTLPAGVDENQVEASLNDGVLQLKIGKADEVKPRRIDVK